MPGRDRHDAQAKWNEGLYAALGKSAATQSFTDWSVTILFYSAVHSVEAFLATHKEHSHSHRDRLDRLLNHHRYDAAQNLSTLLDASASARYSCQPLPPDWRVELLARVALKDLPVHLQ